MYPRCCHRELTEAEASVIGWNTPVDIDLKTIFLQSRYQYFEQETVLKDAAAQSDAVQLRVFARFTGRRRKQFGDSTMEATGNM